MRLHEQNFAIQLLYRPKDTGLDVTLECVTPDPINFLDISIEHDQDGFYTRSCTTSATRCTRRASWEQSSASHTTMPPCHSRCCTGW